MPQKSPYPSIDIPDVDIWTLLFEREEKPFPDDKEIFIDGDTGRSYTFARLRDAAANFGRGLRAQWDWQPGDVLAFFTPNCVDTPAVTWGLLWAGGTASPANPLYTVDELAFQLRDTRARAVVTQAPFLDAARAAARRAGIPDDRILLVGDGRDPSGRSRHFTEVRDAEGRAGQPGGPERARVDPRTHLAFLVYSSGTSGLPKGVCLSHRNVVANTLQFGEIEGQYLRTHGGPDGKGDKQLGVLPFFHIYGLVCVLHMTVWRGFQAIVMDRFDLAKACGHIERHGISFAYVPPPIVLALGKDPVVAGYDLTSLKFLNSGAAPLTREIAEAVWDRLKIPVKQGYGLSETSPVVTTQTVDEWAKFMGSCGKLMPNQEVKIVGPEGDEVPEGEEGELWVKGPNVFLGYLNQPELTRDAFSPCGYFKTGDVFRRDKYGNYFCTDRLKELIKYKGFQVPPAALEGLLLGHDDVVDACVVGVEDRARATEVPRAYVVLRDAGTACDEKAREIADWAAGRVAPHKKLRGGVRFVDAVPKTASGKILRRVMKEQIRKEEEEEEEARQRQKQAAKAKL